MSLESHRIVTPKEASDMKKALENWQRAKYLLERMVAFAAHDKSSPMDKHLINEAKALIKKK